MSGNLGQLRTEKSIASAEGEIKSWLDKIGVHRMDVVIQSDPRMNVAVLKFRYKSQSYEFRSNKQSNSRLNMHGIARVIEYKVRSQIMGIEDFEKSMKAYLALPNYSAAADAPLPTADAQAYAKLGISPTASNEEIKEHYKKMVKAFHPDMANSIEAKREFEKRLSEINEAWDSIKRERSL